MGKLSRLMDICFKILLEGFRGEVFNRLPSLIHYRWFDHDSLFSLFSDLRSS